MTREEGSLKLKWKQGVALALTVICSGASSVLALGAQTTLEKQMTQTAAYLTQTVTDPQCSSVGGEWTVLGLARSNEAVPEGYFDTYYENLEQTVKEKAGVLHEKKYTEYARVTVALSALGKDPRDVAGYDLLMPLGDYEKTIWQGMNGPIWALIALDSGEYEVPQNTQATTQATRQMYIQRILDCQLEDGGWSLFGGTQWATEADQVADADITGMALQALAPYQQEPKVKEAIEKALDALSNMQGKDGGFAAKGTETVESTVQVLVGLCALGVDLEDGRFVKDGNTLLDSLFSFALEDGSFYHSYGEKTANLMATEQAFYGMVAAWRSQNAMPSLYTMTDVATEEKADTSTPEAETQESTATKTFADVSEAEQEAVGALAAEGIVGGMEDGLFHPDWSVTRAQFATMLTLAFDLKATKEAPFTDISDHWAKDSITAAYEAGLLSGRSATIFDPEGTITRQEAAVMVANGAKRLGLDVGYDTEQSRNVLSLFTDYVEADGWAWSSLAFCLDQGILQEDGMTLEPKEAMNRGETAQLLYGLLQLAA